MRVGITARSVYPLHGYGGLERHVYDLARALVRRDVDVTLITRPPTVPDMPRTAEAIHPSIEAIFVPYRTFPGAGRRGTTVIDRSTAYPLFGLRAGREALRLVRAGRIDLVHGLGASVLGYARERESAGAPLVFNPQGLEEFGATAPPGAARLKRAAYLPLQRAVLACAASADAVIATDRSLEDTVLRHLQIDPMRLRTIPNALDLEYIDSLIAAARRDGVRSDAPRAGETILLSVGRIEKNKGFQILVAALAALQDRGAIEGPWRWVLVGDGPYRTGLQAHVDRTNLGEHVLVTGRLDDPSLHAWHAAATLFVHPTLYEGSSLVTLEAMAHGKAIVATRAGGLPDKVRPGENGWLVEPGDAGGLAAAISGALADRDRLATYGAASRRIVEHDFSWTAAGDATLALYHNLLE